MKRNKQKHISDKSVGAGSSKVVGESARKAPTLLAQSVGKVIQRVAFLVFFKTLNGALSAPKPTLGPSPTFGIDTNIDVGDGTRVLCVESNTGSDRCLILCVLGYLLE